MSDYKNTFIQHGNVFSMTGSDFQSQYPLKRGIYNMTFHPMEGIKLEYMSEEFEFPFKVYGLDVAFKDHLINMYQNLDHGMGILLNGTKGAGKTVTAKTVSNALGLPVILISKPFPGYVNFIAKLEFPCVFFFDEFEKNFKKDMSGDNGDDDGEALLSVMDGCYSNHLKHVFIMTTNQMYINDNFISRPGRIRYLRTYGNLEESVVRAYLQDNLLDKEKLEETFDVINELEIVTIDIIKSVVEEINFCNCEPRTAVQYLNLKKADNQYRVIVRTVYGFDTEDYTMDDFVKEIKLIGTPKPQPEDWDEEEDGKWDFPKYTLGDFNMAHRKVGTSHRVSWTMKGDRFGWGTIETEYDPAKQTLGCIDSDGDYHYYYYIENPDQRTLVYGAPRELIY